MSEAGYIKDEHYQFLLQYFPANKISNRLNIERANVDKIYGYELFWFLHRHPLVIL